MGSFMSDLSFRKIAVGEGGRRQNKPVEIPVKSAKHMA
jgi:hypothetical protein